MNEKEWVDSLVPRLSGVMGSLNLTDVKVQVESAYRLNYAFEILRYRRDEKNNVLHSKGYQTDLLISDRYEGGDWVPRVVIECKLHSVTTHDALTYSSKSSTHKNVHPYLRYGIVIGNYGEAIPARLASVITSLARFSP